MGNAAGYKTRQREIILDCLIHQNNHITIDDIVDYLKQNDTAVGKTTVYRYLEKLVEEGNVKKYYLEEGMGACYQYLADPEKCHQHYHLKCTGCGRLIHVECDYLDEIESHMEADHHFTLDRSRIVLYGLCEACRAISDGSFT